MPLWQSAVATYPLELVEADRFVKDKKELKGDTLIAEVDKRAGTTA